MTQYFSSVASYGLLYGDVEKAMREPVEQRYPLIEFDKYVFGVRNNPAITCLSFQYYRD